MVGCFIFVYGGNFTKIILPFFFLCCTVIFLSNFLQLVRTALLSVLRSRNLSFITFVTELRLMSSSPAVFKVPSSINTTNMKSVANAARLATKRPYRVSIEGNIGSGKSTCIKHFEKFNNVETHAEPIKEWRNVSGHNLLGLLYSDMNKWTFPFQHYVLLSRLKIQTSPPSHPGITVKMFERSVQNSRHCFVEMAKKQKFLADPEYQVLMSWFDYTEKHLDVSLDLIVYLKTSPQIVWERMMRRGRAEESEVPLEYLQQVHDSYENWLSSPDVGCEVLTIDADKNLDSVLEDLERYNYKILGGNHTN